MKKLTIEEMREIARNRRGKCLSKKYIDTNTKLKWECERGHTWEAKPGNIKNKGSWCPECLKVGIKEFHRIAEEQGGKCLSTQYVNNYTKLKFQCSEGHQWEATPSNIMRGTWCYRCLHKRITDNKRLSIQEMKELAIAKGGKCLSTKYTNNYTPLEWECENGHRWKAKGKSIKRGNWCKKCAMNEQKLGIKKMRDVARGRGGKCLSQNYINLDTKLIWECARGHRWKATPHSVKTAGNWCSICSGVYKRNIEEMHILAEAKGGKCLSEGYINTHTKLKWQCQKGHSWEVSPHGVKSGYWCPICSQGRSERICRLYFERLFNSKFPTTSPRWLINNEGNGMHLDGFNKALKLAFEYNGVQHYKFKEFFHDSKQSLKKRKLDDLIKLKLCQERGILLVIVPYTISYDNMQDYIMKYISYFVKRGEYDITIPDLKHRIKINPNKVSATQFKDITEFSDMEAS